MALTPLPQMDLRALARQDDIELRVDRTRQRDDQLLTKEGSFGGRLIRWFSAPPTQEKQRQNIDAKVEVWRALNDMYGEEIGTKVFRANIGHMQDGVHVSSQYHPITGRHIRNMLEQGDLEMQKSGRQRYDYKPDPEKFSKELTKLSTDEMKRLDIGKPGNTIEVCGLFKKDADRSAFLVQANGRDHLLTLESAPEIMTTLVEGGTSEEDKTAIYNLSVLLNQTLGNSMLEEVLLTKFMETPYLPGGAVRTQGNVSRDGDTIRIDLSLVQPMRRLGTMERFSSEDDLDPQSSLKGSVTLEISAKDLRAPGGHDMFKLVQEPKFKIDLKPLEGPRGHDDAEKAAHMQVNILLQENNGRLVSNAIGCFGEPSKDLHGVIGAPEDRTFDDLPGLDPNGVKNLSRLLSQSTGTGLHEAMMKKVLNDDDFTLKPEDRELLSTNITPLVLDDGREVIDIEYRGVIPREVLENAPLTVVFDMSRETGDTDLDTVVRLRVPVDQLNQETLPEVFDFLHPWRLESRPRDGV